MEYERVFFFLNGHLESQGSGLNDMLQKDGKELLKQPH